MELQNRKLKDRKKNNKREIEKQFYKLLIASKDKFEEQEMKKIRPIKKKLVQGFFWKIRLLWA